MKEMLLEEWMAGVPLNKIWPDGVVLPVAVELIRRKAAREDVMLLDDIRATLCEMAYEQFQIDGYDLDFYKRSALSAYFPEEEFSDI